MGQETRLRKDAALEPGHVVQQIRIVLRVHAHKGALPVNRRHRTRQTILDVPKDGTSTEKQRNSCSTAEQTQQHARWASPRPVGEMDNLASTGTKNEQSHSQVNVVLHQAHPGVPRPTLLVVVTHDVLDVRVRMLGQVALDQVTRLVGGEPTDREPERSNHTSRNNLGE